MQKRLRLAALLVFAAAAGLTAGQNPPPQPPAPTQPPPQQQAQQPTFRVRVDYVEVDVVVTDRQGNLVRDLKKEDFQVLEDGKGQAINTFTFVDIPVERGDRPLFADSPIEPDVKTNERPFDGRVYVMVIDDLHTRFGRSARVKIAAKQFVERRLGANDLMAVVHTFGPSDANQEFTNNKRLLIAAIDRTNGKKLDSATANKTREYYATQGIRQQGDPLNDPADNERAFNARNALDTLKNVAEWFGSVHGRRKSILFVSEGIDYDIYDMIASNGSNHQSASMVMDATRDAIAAATRSNVAIYGIDPRGLTDLGDESIEIGSFPDDTSLGIGQSSLQNELRLSQDSLRTLSDETGGFAVVNRNDFASAYQRLVEDNSSYYVLAYYPPDARPGRLHKIDVRVTRPGLTVRARKGYVTPKKVEESKTTNSKNPSTPELREALDSPLPVSGLTMHVFAAPFKGTAPNVSVLFGVEMRGRDLQLAQNAKLLLSYLAIDQNGKIKGGNTDSLSMPNLKPETKARIEQTGLRMLNRLDLPPGKYSLRVAAHDTNGGNVGSVQYDLAVPDFQKEKFSISGLVLTSGLGAALPTVRADEQLKQVLPGPAISSRSFPQNDEIVLFTEVYDNEGSKPHKVDIVTTIRTDEGREVFKTDETRDSTDLGGARGGYGYTTKIPLKELEPGKYVLKVEGKSRLGNDPAVGRELRIEITPPVAR
ncbi:MAG TPA: VWA domain-containing protein [Vicinamibacterales bacterium]|nr:VWA domain-containing protein [Vicinamibacterales bacterium]